MAIAPESRLHQCLEVMSKIMFKLYQKSPRNYITITSFMVAFVINSQIETTKCEAQVVLCFSQSFDLLYT